MLSHLSIRNFALIERLDLELGQGFIGVTGETGAGKSIVFDALALLVGGRATTDVIRSGEDTCTVQGLFDIDGPARPFVDAELEAAGIPASGHLLIRRVLSRTGPNRVYVNDTLATVALLQRALDPLVEVVGQHEHLTLMRPDTHRELVDRFAELEDDADKMAAAYAKYRAAKKQLDELEAAREARAERIDFLRFQLDELRGLELEDGEVDKLERTLERARNSERLREAAHSVAYALNDGDGSAAEQMVTAIDALTRVQATDPELGALIPTLQEALATVGDLAREARSYAQALRGETYDLDTLESRDQRLKRAFRKYGSDEQGLIAKLAGGEAELGQLENFEEALGGAARAVDKAYTEAVVVADALDKTRRAKALTLFEEVVEMLQLLGMESAVLQLREPDESRQLVATGWAGIEILFSANAGEPPGPIGRIASGGELSRLMLALKTAVSSSDRLQTYTFDEVDTGIGGGTAEVVGRLLRRLANEKGGNRQVLCVTHHAQIACFADIHLRAEKTVADGRTFSRLVALEPDERVREVARMLGGRELTDVTLAHARTMIEASGMDG